MSSPRPTKQPRHRKGGRGAGYCSWRNTAKIGLALLLVYLALVIRSSQILNHVHRMQSEYITMEQNQTGASLFNAPIILPKGPATSPTLDGMFANRLTLEKARTADRLDVERHRQSAHDERGIRRRPAMPQDVETYSFARMDAEPRASATNHNANMGENQDGNEHGSNQQLALASLQQLCGTHARNASLAEPTSFRAKDALNSKSRVLITGILNPIGFNLALTLKERCGVEVIGGIDPMFPNTVLNRMQLQQRIAMLVTNIPRLIQPIILPLIGLDPRENKQKPAKDEDKLDATDELNLMATMKPTHVVHLASYAPDLYKIEENFWNTESPYCGDTRNADMFRVRSSIVAMEHVLASVGSALSDSERPHLTYASSEAPITDESSDSIHLHFKLADEVLADTYFAQHGVFSARVRLPNAVYGPWSSPASPLYQIIEHTVKNWGRSSALILEETTNRTDARHLQHLTYVNDVVDGIIAAMQYRKANSEPVVFDLGPDTATTLSSISKLVVAQMPGDQRTTSPNMDLISTSSVNALAKQTRETLAWSPETKHHHGVTKTIAWHLDQSFPFGEHMKKSSNGAHSRPMQFETGDKFRQRIDLETCAANDLLCHAGPKFLPCASECNTRHKCTPSVFDDVRDLILETAQDCDIVLYTQSLGRDVQDLRLQAKYKDEGRQIICNFAFVPRQSRLVSNAISKVPQEQLDALGVRAKPGQSALDNKLDGLNGKLLYKGWILMWIRDTHVELPPPDKFLMKLTPGLFFPPEVKHALYVDEDFPVSPNLEDVLFLVSQAHRPRIKERKVFRKEDDGRKHKYRLAKEPERRAVMLLAPLKQKIHNEPEGPEKDKLTVYEAVNFMLSELGEDHAAKERPLDLKRQREFYERVPTFTNRNDMRSGNEPLYRFELKHWVRTRWLVHDMELEEGRQLRCEWFQEHVQWGNDLDQLSFAYVMARREIERRISHREPDDHVKPPHIQHPELMTLTDAHEWHALDSEENRLAHIHPLDAFSLIPEHMIEKEENDEEAEDAAAEQMWLHHSEPKHRSKSVPLFVRIMSDKVMMLARKAWSKKHRGKVSKKKK